MRVSDYAQFATLTQGREVIHGVLWDTLQYTSGATTVLTFFQQTQAAVGLDVTNMTNPGQLPYPKQFLVRAGRLFLKQRPESVNIVGPAAVQTGAINNIALLINTGILRITHGAKEYGTYPLHLFATGGGPCGTIHVQNILVAGAYADYGVLGVPHAKNVYTFAIPMLIETSMNFNYQMLWPAGFVTLTRNLPICFALEGDEIRPVQ